MTVSCQHLRSPHHSFTCPAMPGCPPTPSFGSNAIARSSVPCLALQTMDVPVSPEGNMMQWTPRNVERRAAGSVISARPLQSAPVGQRAPTCRSSSVGLRKNPLIRRTALNDARSLSAQRRHSATSSVSDADPSGALARASTCTLSTTSSVSTALNDARRISAQRRHSATSSVSDADPCGEWDVDQTPSTVNVSATSADSLSAISTQPSANNSVEVPPGQPGSEPKESSEESDDESLGGNLDRIGGMVDSTQQLLQSLKWVVSSSAAATPPVVGVSTECVQQLQHRVDRLESREQMWGTTLRGVQDALTQVQMDIAGTRGETHAGQRRVANLEQQVVFLQGLLRNLCNTMPQEAMNQRASLNTPAQSSSTQLSATLVTSVSNVFRRLSAPPGGAVHLRSQRQTPRSAREVVVARPNGLPARATRDSGTLMPSPNDHLTRVSPRNSHMLPSARQPYRQHSTACVGRGGFARMQH